MLSGAPRWLVLFVILALSGRSGGAAEQKPETTNSGEAGVVKVGDFLLLYAQAMNLSLAEGAGSKEAVAELVNRGIVEQPGDLLRPLTEGDVVRFASKMGLRLTTLHADRIFPPDKVGPFFRTFGGALRGASQGQSLGFDALSTGTGPDNPGLERAREKAKGKKFRESPPEP
ncbi:MAG: hypothetical protein ACE5HD_03070 [Acidobacteriota bacterium]